jgi:predicted RNase H-like nuclease (RuvC/YqgF family)
MEKEQNRKVEQAVAKTIKDKENKERELEEKIESLTEKNEELEEKLTHTDKNTAALEREKEEVQNELDAVEEELLEIKEIGREKFKEELEEELEEEHNKKLEKVLIEFKELQTNYEILQRKHEEQSKFTDIANVAVNVLNHFLKYEYKSTPQMQNVEKLIVGKEYIPPKTRQYLQKTFHVLGYIFEEYSEQLKNTPTMVDVNPAAPEHRGT